MSPVRAVLSMSLVASTSWWLALVASPPPPPLLPLPPLPPVVWELWLALAVAVLLAPLPAEALLLPVTVPPLASDEIHTTVVTFCDASTSPLPLPAATVFPLPAATPTEDVPPAALMSPVEAWLSTSFVAATSWVLALVASPPPPPPPLPLSPARVAEAWSP